MKPKILTLSKYLGPDHTTVRNFLVKLFVNLWGLLSEHIFHLWTKQYDPLSVLENGGISECYDGNFADPAAEKGAVVKFFCCGENLVNDL